jgi:hypothetical protein
LSAFALNAQDYYRVVSSKRLNVRSEATSQSEIIAQLEPGEEFLVYAWDGYWAQTYINGQYGYVYSDYIEYLRLYSQPVAQEKTKSSETFLDMLPDFEEYKDEATSKTLFYSSLGLLIVSLIILLLIINDVIDSNVGFWASIASILFASCSICELSYIIFSPDQLWFCSPSVVGWIWTIVNFLLFGVFVVAQCITFVFLLVLIQSRGRYDSCLPISMIGVPILVVVFILFNMFWKDSIDVVFYIGGALILLQLAFILYKSFQEECMGIGLLMSLFYLIGLAGTIMVLIAFVVLFIIAALILIGVCIVLAMLAGGASGSGRSKGSSRAEILDEYGKHVAYINDDGWGDDGNRYRKENDGNWSRY